MNFKKIMVGVVASVAAVSAMAVAANAATAGLIYQTNAWTFRNTIAQTNGIWWDEFDEANNYETWNVSDVAITGDGQYTASCEKNVMEDCKDGPESAWNFLKLQTDIAAADYPDLQITVDSLKVDGNEIAGATAAVLGPENLTIDDYSDGCNGITDTVVDAYTIGFVNIWNDEQTCIEASDFGGKVEVTFTVSGFGGAASDGTDADDNTVDAGAGDTSAPTTGDKGAADTGVEGVAVVAAIAIVAAGAVVVAKKRS